MSALTEVARLSPPMVNVTGTAFVIRGPGQTARCANATNAQRNVSVGVSSACRLTPTNRSQCLHAKSINERAPP
jgi:hypothetical protein